MRAFAVGVCLMLGAAPAAAWEYKSEIDPIHRTEAHSVGASIEYFRAVASITFRCEARRLIVGVASSSPVLGGLEYRVDNGPSATLTARPILRNAFEITGGAALTMFNRARAARGTMLVRIVGPATNEVKTLSMAGFAAAAAPVARACGIR